MFHQDFLENGYDIFYFTPFSSKAAWISLNPRQAITNKISQQHTEAEPPNITPHSLMSMTSLPLTHPNPPQIEPFDQTTALVNFMTQQMHQNLALMAQLQRQASLTVPQMTFTQNLKIQRPPFPKWEGMPTTKPLFLAQVENYKDEAY